MIGLSRIRLFYFAFFLGTSLAIPHMVTAQTAGPRGLAAVDGPFQPLKPEAATPKGVSTQSSGRQLGLKTLRSIANKSGFLEQPAIQRGKDGAGDGDLGSLSARSGAEAISKSDGRRGSD